MSLLYIAAGINHLIHPSFYLKIMPAWLPWHDAMNSISGLAEIILGLMLLSCSTRRLAAWGIIVLLIAIFPANIQMMLNYRATNHPDLWIIILRLPIQVLLIYWAWLFTKRNKSLNTDRIKNLV